MADFAHLHLHTQYSLLDGAIRVKDLFPKVLELGMKTVAATDHGNMYGAVDLYSTARKHGVKLIFGCETYVSATDRSDRTNRRAYHLVLLAKNEVGYKNLSYLNSMGFLEGFYYNPRIDKQLLREHSEGLIGLSACLGGEVAQTLLKRGVAEAEKIALEYKDIFAPGDYYLELMDNGEPEQYQINEEYRSMGPRLGIPMVATNDCHYVERSDARAQEILMSIQSNKSLSDEKRLKHKQDAYYIKPASVMEKAFHDMPEVLENAAKIASQCNVELALDETYFLPKYSLPEGPQPPEGPATSHRGALLFRPQPQGRRRRPRTLSLLGVPQTRGRHCSPRRGSRPPARGGRDSARRSASAARAARRRGPRRA